MTFEELDKLVFTSLKNTWGEKVERRDYRQLEIENQYFYKNKSTKSGLMFLVDVTYDLYVDINIFEDYITMKFRKDDHKLMLIDSRIDLGYQNTEDQIYGRNRFCNCDKLLDYFLKLIDEYLYVEERFKQINSGKIPQDLIRGNKISSILS